jgi:hypothetical protein
MGVAFFMQLFLVLGDHMGRKPSTVQKTEKLLDSQLLEKQHQLRLPWNVRKPNAKTKSSSQEAKEYLSEFVLGFLLGHPGDSRE